MVSFNYQYNLSRPYPGRYTTFIVTPLAVITCVMIVLINIPLSAYETRQEFTYTPNSTNNAVQFSNLVPAFLRKHSVQFTPHTFVIGDNFQTDLGAFNYRITNAYSRKDTSSKPKATDSLSSFAYMNFDLSSCDVMYLTITAAPGGVSASALISCWYPVFFQFEMLSINVADLVSADLADLGMTNAILQIEEDYAFQLTSSLNMTWGPDPREPISGFNIVFQPCCTTCNEPTWDPNFNYTADYALEAHEIYDDSFKSLFFYGHPACDDKEVNFKLPYDASQNPYNVTQFVSYLQSGESLIFPYTVNDTIYGFIHAPEDFPALNYNVLRALYHGIRLDLGVIRPNQIYNSSTQFNSSISEINPLSPGLYGISMTNLARGDRFETDGVNLSTPPYNQRVPKILYLISVFTPKPLGQAIAAVFVATFSMITALWNVVNFIASSLVTARSEKATFCPCPTCQGHDIAFHKVQMQDESHDLEWGEVEGAATDDSDERRLEHNPQLQGMSGTQLRYRSTI